MMAPPSLQGFRDWKGSDWPAVVFFIVLVAMFVVPISAGLLMKYNHTQTVIPSSLEERQTLALEQIAAELERLNDDRCEPGP